MLPTDPSILELFKKNEALRGLEQHEIECLLNISIRKQYNKNQAVFADDQQARHLYLVETGTFVLNLRDRKFKSF